jgi:hypothetical protein
MAFYIRTVKINRWRGVTPPDEETRTQAKKDWTRRTPPKDLDGVSIYMADSDRVEEHPLIAVAVVADRQIKDGKLDDDNVDLLLVTDNDFAGLGSPMHTPADSCIASVGERHSALNWNQQELDALALRLSNAGREAHRFSRVDLREILIGLRREQVECDDVWNCIEQKREEWRTYVEKERKKERERAERKR